MNYIISKDKAKIAFDVLGEGKKIIYITGAICHRNFRPVLDDAKIFAKNYSVVNYDRRGRGDSTDILPYSITKELDDIEALIDSSHEKVILYGHSSGAILALEAGLRFPDKIEKIVIYDPAYVHNLDYKAEYAILQSKISNLLNKKNHSSALKCFLSGIGMPKLFIFFLPLFPGWGKLKSLAPTLNYDMELTKDLPPLDRLSKLQVPLKIVYGEKSPESIRTVSVMISKCIPNAKLHELKGQDHMASAKILLNVFKDFI